MNVNILPENVSYLTEWLTDKINGNVKTFSVLARHLNPVALTGEINRSLTVTLEEGPLGIHNKCFSLQTRVPFGS